MAHKRFEFIMPAECAVVFDAFHYHCWRMRWDSLVKKTAITDGAECPYQGAISENRGRGWMGKLTMRTRFVSYNRPKVAAATMLGTSFPFAQWAASMQHKPLTENQSLLIYTYTFSTVPAFLRFIIEPVVIRIFDWQTQRRFKRLRQFLALHAEEIRQWQTQRTEPAPASTFRVLTRTIV